MRRSPLFIALCLAFTSGLSAASAQDSRHDEPTTLDTVEVHATPLPGTADSLTLPVEVLAGERLDEAKANSLGETVGKLPGVQASYFGPGVGRPVVRGLDGARVQVLSGGLGAGDVSTVSADHAVSIEPFLADQIEVLKGPATLLYGSGAIGGAVNVVDGRVPERATDQPLQGRAELRAGSVNDERTGMLRLDGTSASGRLVLHADALHRETGDYEIPGFAESATLLAEEGEVPDPATAGQLTNSFVRTDSGALGVSWIGARGFLGAGASLFDTRYGVPGHAHEEEEGEAEEEEGHGGVSIAMQQHRTDVRAGLDDFGAFASLRVKLAKTDYTHTEFEGDAVGTVFDNDSLEGRVELVHEPLAGWNGAFGAQWGRREFVAVGEEAFVPGSTASDAGLFWIGQRDLGPVKLELGARHDRNRVEVDEAIAIGGDRDFDTTSLSASAKWKLSEGVHLVFGLDRAQRAPTAEELYSDGVHVATQSVERGDPSLGVETAKRAEAGVHWHGGGPVKLSLTLYQTRFDDFVYLADTGATVDALPERQWSQADARFTGGEAALDWAIADNASGLWDLRVFADRVNGRLDDGGNLPRIVPARVGGTLRWEREAWRASLGAVRFARQDDVAAFESPTPGYTLVDAHLAWHVDTEAGNGWEVFVDGTNLLDEEARPHVSFLKDLAPLPGRGVAVGVRAFF